MISTQEVTLSYGKQILLENVTINFAPGNCYGLIGANGSGKSTFLKILSGEIEPTRGTVSVPSGARISVLKQNHFEFDEFPVLETVIMGHKKLYSIMQERNAIYAKPDFNDNDGLRISTLEEEFTFLNGWEAESEAAKLLSGLGIKEKSHTKLMKELSGSEKVRVLLAQALFHDPDVLLMDEPTNNLDVETIIWLEEYIYQFKNTIIVVSHDRHFLDKVCTYTADIDFGKIQIFTGNYSFWAGASKLALQQKQDHNKRMEARAQELKDFIARFSANASKAKQATSRKIFLDKITLEDIKPSSRRYPHISFKPEREAGNNILDINKLSKKGLFENLTLTIDKGDKVVLLGRNPLASTAFFQILMGEIKPDAGTYTWGVTTTQAYLPKDNTKYFEEKIDLLDWLRQYSKEKAEGYIRGFLGQMLFSGDAVKKTADVLSGGEKMRCMIAKMLLSGANVILLDEPTNHLDLESISAFNEGLMDFKGTAFFTSHDHQFIQTSANRIIELAPNGYIDMKMTYDEYLSDELVKEKRAKLYGEE